MSGNDMEGLTETLIERSKRASEHWYQRIKETSYVPMSDRDLRERLHGLTLEMLEVLLKGEYDRHRAERFGKGLAALDLDAPDSLATALIVLLGEVTRGLDEERSRVVKKRIDGAIPDICRGFVNGFRAETLGKKDDVRKRLSIDLQELNEELHRSRESFEERVRDRTEELLLANDELIREVQARARAQEMLREANQDLENLEMIINNSSSMVFLWKYKEGWPLEYVSENVEHLGFDADGLLSGNVKYIDLVHPEDRERVIGEVERHIRDGLDVYQQEYRLDRPNGEVIWVESRTTVRRDYRKEITHLQSIVMDVTERKRAVEALRESEKRFSMVIEATHTGIWDWDFVSGELYFSPMWKAIIGYEDHEIKNEFNEWSDRLHPDDRERMLKNVEEFLEKPVGRFNHQFRMKHKDGSYRWINNRSSVIVGEDGKPLRMFGSHLDITERKEVEEALQESREQYRNLLEGTKDIPFKVSPEGTIIYIGPQMVDLGIDPGGLMGRNYRDLIGLFPEEDRDYNVENFQRKVETRDETSNIFRIVDRNGRVRWVEERSRVIPDDQGEVQIINGVLRDITERKRAQDEAERSNRYLRTINRIMRHDVKNRLTVIYGIIDLLRSGRTVDRKLIDHAHESATKCVEICERARGLEEQMDVRGARDPMDVREVIEEEAKGVPLEVVIEGDARVLADGALHSVIGNLMQNSEVHGEAKRVLFDITDDRRMVRISVEDDGRGVPRGVDGALFAEGQSCGKSGGSGLGLYLARAIVEMYGGTLEYDNEYDKGARFVLTLEKG